MKWWSIKSLRPGSRAEVEAVCAACGSTVVTRAEAVFSAFGGVGELTKALFDIGVHRNRSSLYRWTYPKADGGMDGRVPPRMWGPIHKAAKAKGIRL